MACKDKEVAEAGSEELKDEREELASK